MRKKAQAEITEIISLVAIGIALIFFFVVILPKFVDTMFQLIALASAQVVSRDLAGLITISGAAPGRITIFYQPQAKYNVGIADRIVSVELLEGLKDRATAKAGVDPSPPPFESVNYFEIRKWVEVQQIKTGEKACEGTALSCNSFDPTAKNGCKNQLGCSWCGCWVWTLYPLLGYCKDVPIYDCLLYSPSEWRGCEGTATSCRSLTPETCTSQEGCYVSEKIVSHIEVKYEVEAYEK